MMLPDLSEQKQGSMTSRCADGNAMSACLRDGATGREDPVTLITLCARGLQASNGALGIARTDVNPRLHAFDERQHAHRQDVGKVLH
jgi:hypothetical protein